MSCVLLLKFECLESLGTAACPLISLDIFQTSEAYLSLPDEV